MSRPSSATRCRRRLANLGMRSRTCASVSLPLWDLVRSRSAHAGGERNWCVPRPHARIGNAPDPTTVGKRRRMSWNAYPSWLNAGDNAWQMTAATFVGLMSLPGLAVLYGGVMQKRWSVNSMMLTFIAFAVVLVLWVLYGYNMAFGQPVHVFGNSTSFFSTFIGHPSSVLSSHDLEKQGNIPLIGDVAFPQSTLVYFQ